MTATPPVAAPTLVSDIMLTTVISVDPRMQLWQVAELFVGKQISGAPVIDGHGRVIAMIGEGLLLRLAAREGLDATVAHCLPADTGANSVVTIKPRDTFTDAYRIFLKPNIRRIPVTDDNGKLVGMLTRSLVLRIFVEAHYGRALPKKS